MQLTNDISLIDGTPYIIINSLSAIVGADFHLGYEVVLADEEGYFLPHAQYNEIIDELEMIFSKYDVKRFIINGDLKHKFSMRTRQETREVLAFIEFLKKHVDSVIIVRGNHDNFVRGLFNKFKNVEFVEPYYLLGDYLFTHGHISNLEITSLMKDYFTIIAHEHPAFLLYDDVGGKIKIPAFLYGRTKLGNEILVLPAASPLMPGSEINLITPSELLSPILRETVDIFELTPYGISRGKETLSFPKLRLWHNITELG